MKIKILSLLTLCVICLTANAQVNFGVNVGPNMGNVTSKYDGKKEEGVKASIGFIIAGDVNIPIGESLLFQTGVQLENINVKSNEETTSNPYPEYTIKTTSTSKLTLLYMNIPAKIYFKLPAGGGFFMVGAGPNLGFAMSGNQKGTYRQESTYQGNTTIMEDNYDDEIKFGSNDGQLKGINFGVGVNLAYLLASNIKIGLFSNIGLSNLDNADKSSFKTMTFGLTFGYVFGNRNSGD